jgi:hypothetical protein
MVLLNHILWPPLTSLLPYAAPLPQLLIYGFGELFLVIYYFFVVYLRRALPRSPQATQLVTSRLHVFIGCRHMGCTTCLVDPFASLVVVEVFCVFSFVIVFLFFIFIFWLYFCLSVFVHRFFFLGFGCLSVTLTQLFSMSVL